MRSCSSSPEASRIESGTASCSTSLPPQVESCHARPESWAPVFASVRQPSSLTYTTRVTANNRWRGKKDEDAEGLGGRLGLTRKSTKGDDQPGSGCLLIFIPFLAMGAIAFAIGAKELYDQYTFRSVAIHATGEVVGHDSSAGSRGQQFHPIVRCKAANGETFQFRCRYAYPKETYPLGEAVDVLYDPA